MSTRLALSVAAVTMTVAFIAACTGSSDDDDDNGQLIGGTGGAAAGSAGSASAGTSASSGSGGGGGSAGSGGSSTGTPGIVGAACTATADCAAGLECLTPSSTELGGSPAGGLCTLPCTGDVDCTTVDPNAWCVGFGDAAYCLEGCLFDNGGPAKCHDRLDFLCTGVDSLATDVACTSTSQCGLNEVCLSSICTVVLTVCLPACGSDADCADGQFCNYGSGLCQAAAPTGLGFNEACSPAADPDECGGFCRTSYDDTTVGSCSGACNLANPRACGYTGEGPANAACLFPSSLAGADIEIGDVGSCSQVCDCNSDCTVPGEYCQPWDPTVAADQKELFQRDGMCFPIIPAAEGGTFTVADSLDCGTGAGGASSMPPAGGAGGAP